MKAFSYIIFLMLLAFTLFNLFATATAKKRKAYAKTSFATALKPIEDKLLQEQKARKLRFDVVKRMVNDRNQAFIFCYDPKAKMFAVGSDGTRLIGNAAELCHINKEYQVGRFGRVMESAVSFSFQGSDYTFPIGTRPYWRRGILGSVLYETTEEFYQALKNAEKDARNEI